MGLRFYKSVQLNIISSFISTHHLPILVLIPLLVLIPILIPPIPSSSPSSSPHSFLIPSSCSFSTSSSPFYLILLILSHLPHPHLHSISSSSISSLLLLACPWSVNPVLSSIQQDFISTSFQNIISA